MASLGRGGIAQQASEAGGEARQRDRNGERERAGARERERGETPSNINKWATCRLEKVTRGEAPERLNR